MPTSGQPSTVSRNQTSCQNRLYAGSRGRAQALPGRVNSTSKVREEEEKAPPSEGTEKLRRASAREEGAAASSAPWGTPKQVVSKQVKGFDVCFRKVTLGAE